MLLGERASSSETLLLGLLGFLACVTVMAITAKAQGIQGASWNRALILLLVGAVLVGAGLIALRIYAFPRLPASWDRPLTVVIAGGVLTVLVVIPVQCKLQSANYLQGAINLVFGIGAAIGVVILLNALMEASLHEKQEFGKIKDRTEDMDSFLKK